MYLYECRRYESGDGESWRGALLIAANNKEEAIECFKTYGDEWDGDEPEEVIDMGVTLFKTSDRPFVVYNDYTR